MFIQKLNELITEKNISRYQLSKTIGIGDSTIYGWDKGQQPTADKLIKLADYFEVSTDYLLGRESDIGVVEVNKDLPQLDKDLLYAFHKLKKDDQYRVLGYTQALANN